MNETLIETESNDIFELDLSESITDVSINPDKKILFGDINFIHPGIKEKKPLFKIYENYNQGFEGVKDSAYDQKNILGELATSGELIIIFGVSNTGKSTFVIQLAEALASGQNFFDITFLVENNTREKECYKLNNVLPAQKIIYADFESTMEKTRLRYSNNERMPYCFSDNIKVLMPNQRSINNKLGFITAIEEIIKTGDTKILIIDNMTAISEHAEDRDFAVRVMDRLKDFQDRYKLTIIVVAHCPKGKDLRIKTMDDLAGSSNFGNLADSVLAIGNTAINSDLRYIKQLKSRIYEKRFDTDNVILIKIKKMSNGFLGFDFVGYENEEPLIKITEKSVKEEETQDIINRVKHFGTGAYEIAEELHEKYAKDVSLETYKERIKKRVQRLKNKGLLEQICTVIN